MATFESCWRELRAEFPLAGPLLCRNWVQEGFTRACDQHGWAFLRGESAIFIQAARNLTVGVTYNSPTVTSAAGFVPGDAGRQLRMSSVTGHVSLGIPIYTIVSVDNPSQVTLDLPYSRDTDPAAIGQILDAYTNTPADFRRFIVIYDTYYLRTIPFWLDQDQIAIADPGRIISDTGPRYLVARKYSSAPATLGQVQYEYWPYPTSQRSYPFLYYKAAPVLNDTDQLPGVWSTRADLLKAYGRFRAARWPGTGDQKNPGYSVSDATFFKQEWESELNRLVLRDDDEYPQQSMTIHWMRRFGAIAPTASLLRQTDATINDYF